MKRDGITGIVTAQEPHESIISGNWTTPYADYRCWGARMSAQILPRLIRLRDAANYLGMDPNRFNTEVRPYLIEIPIGKQGIAFDRLDLDAWVDQYKESNGRPGKQKGENKPWDARKFQVSMKETGSGTSTRKSEKEEFARALERATSKKRNGT